MVYILFATVFILISITFWLNKRVSNTTAALKQKTLDLEKTSKLLIEKNVELFDRNIRLEKLLEAKTDFVGIASHQLRTPLTEIKWGIETILDGSFGKFTGEQTAHLKKILDSIFKMVRLIDELLQLVRSEAGYKEFNIKKCDPEKLIKGTVKRIDASFKKKNIAVTFDFKFSKTLMVDKDMLEIALSNLISNSFHYTPAGGKIIVKTKEDNSNFYFEIRDTGIGIPKSKQDLIFKKFKRSEIAMQMYSGGIGLGLYIAKNIIEQHRGQIWFESEEGKGTTFYFILPIT